MCKDSSLCVMLAHFLNTALFNPFLANVLPTIVLSLLSDKILPLITFPFYSCF